MSTGKRPQQWDFASIIKGLRLRVATSKRIYKYLRETEKLPLPSFPSLSLWIRDTFSVKPGVVNSVKLLQMKSLTLHPNERNVILVFGEMNVNPLPCYDILDDQIYGPYNQLLLVVVRSLHSDWFQPIYFEFDQEMTLALLYKVINDVECTGLQVRGVVSEVNVKTTILWQDLKISSEGKTYFVTNHDKKRLALISLYIFFVKLLYIILSI